MGQSGNGCNNRMTNNVTSLSDQISAPPASSGSGGGNGRDTRLDRLERQIDEVNGQLRVMSEMLGTINERLTHVPTRHEITNAIWKTTLAVITAIVGIIIAAIAVLTYLRPLA